MLVDTSPFQLLYQQELGGPAYQSLSSYSPKRNRSLYRTGVCLSLKREFLGDWTNERLPSLPARGRRPSPFWASKVECLVAWANGIVAPDRPMSVDYLSFKFKSPGGTVPGLRHP